MVSSTYAEIDEKYHDTKEALEALSGNKDDKSSGSSSSNAVVRIKEAIRQLKDDISNANVSVHLLSNTLLNIQVRNTKEKQLLNVQKRLRKHVEPSLLEG